MLRVMVSVRREDEPLGRDLELPAEMPSRELADLVGSTLGWTDGALYVHLDPPGRILGEDETLDAAGAVEGASLVFTRSAPPLVEAQAAPVLQEAPPTDNVGPAERRWPAWLARASVAVLVVLAIVALAVWAAFPGATPAIEPLRRATATTTPAETPTPLVLTLQPRS